MWWLWMAGVGLVLAQALTLVQTFGASVPPSTDSQPTRVLLSSLHPAQVSVAVRERDHERKKKSQGNLLPVAGSARSSPGTGPSHTDGPLF